MTFYITTAIDYVNAAPHLGHAYEKIATDVLARFHRLRGEQVFFLTGTDEHGSKVQKTALHHNLDPKQFTDGIAEQFKACWQGLNIHPDRFIRTTDADHYALVSVLWQRLQAKGDIYKHRYEGLYCQGCETFLTTRDITEAGVCHIHQTAPEPVVEENYFFRLSRYKDALKAHIEANPRYILPAFRQQEVLNTLDDLDDISVSRSSVSWGIPVPGDASQTIYVWIDALSNYLTGVGQFNADGQFVSPWWPAACHVIGKDILRFHAIYWSCILMAADLPLPQHIFAHGFINLNDNKISKSLGNVVAPADVLAEFDLQAPDALRYYLMSMTAFGQDGNFTLDDFKTRVNADLANNLGNLLNRATSMTHKYFGGLVPAVEGPCPLSGFTPAETTAWLQGIDSAYNDFALQQAIELILSRVDAANKLINAKEPWTLFKNGELAELAIVMHAVLDTLRMVSVVISPVIPGLAAGIWQQLGYTTDLAQQQWSAKLPNDVLPAGQALPQPVPLFLRLDSAIAGADAKKQGVAP
jgi:methionyl-tRNA synthetase